MRRITCVSGTIEVLSKRRDFLALTNISFIAGTLRSSSSVIKPSEECLANRASIAATSDAAGNSVALAVEDRTIPSFANQGGDDDLS